MLKRISVNDTLTMNAFTSYHNYLNANTGLQLDHIDLSLIDNFEDYTYNTVTRLIKNFYIYSYVVDIVRKENNLDESIDYSFGPGYITYEE